MHSLRLILLLYWMHLYCGLSLQILLFSFCFVRRIKIPPYYSTIIYNNFQLQQPFSERNAYSMVLPFLLKSFDTVSNEPIIPLGCFKLFHSLHFHPLHCSLLIQHLVVINKVKAMLLNGCNCNSFANNC